MASFHRHRISVRDTAADIGILAAPAVEGPHNIAAVHTSMQTILRILLMAALLQMPNGHPGHAEPAPGYAQETYEPTAPGVGLQVASWALTIPYGAAKLGYALAGSVTGSLALLFSAGHLPAAEAVWVRSIYGDYLVRPDHLTGVRPLNFLGRSDGMP